MNFRKRKEVWISKLKPLRFDDYLCSPTGLIAPPPSSSGLNKTINLCINDGLIHRWAYTRGGLIHKILLYVGK